MSAPPLPPLPPRSGRSLLLVASLVFYVRAHRQDANIPKSPHNLPQTLALICASCSASTCKCESRGCRPQVAQGAGSGSGVQSRPAAPRARTARKKNAAQSSASSKQPASIAYAYKNYRTATRPTYVLPPPSSHRYPASKKQVAFRSGRALPRFVDTPAACRHRRMQVQIVGDCGLVWSAAGASCLDETGGPPNVAIDALALRWRSTRAASCAALPPPTNRSP